MLSSSLKRRVILAAGLLVVTFSVGYVVNLGYQHTIRPLSVPLSNLPEQLGDWDGVDQAALDPRTAGVLGADEVLGRLYTNRANNESLSLHLAAWTTPQEIPDPAPHHPEACYTGAGFAVVDRRIETFQTPDGDLRVELIRYHQGESDVVTAHWFQFGSNVILNKNEGRKVQQTLWGRSEWPSTLKVLIHLDGARGLETLHDELSDFIPFVYAWTSKLDKPASTSTDTPQLANHDS